MTTLLTFLSTMRGCSTAGEFVDAMSLFATANGFDAFAYALAVPGTGVPAPFSTFPQSWTDRYVAQRYATIDPVRKRAQQVLLPFTWDGRNPGPEASVDQRRFFDEATAYGINSGFCVPIRDADGPICLMSFVSDRPLSRLRREIHTRRLDLHIAAVQFHAYVASFQSALVAPNEARLSPRELDCLQWIADGKLVKEVANILGVSHRAVVYHLQIAKRKLNAATLPQAVAIALATGRMKGMVGKPVNAQGR
jgi:LuxR family transcriptional regulator, activator of conjugal transfer of Ti plasmids